MKEKVMAALAGIRPALQADGGDIDLIDVSPDGIVKV
ncbi:MAG: NifU family protein, partial [Nitrospirota bacterium]